MTPLGPPSNHDLAPHPPDGHYYASVFDKQANDGRGRVGLLAGPFTTHAEALTILPRATTEAQRVDPRAGWYAFGTICMQKSYTRPGVLNPRLGLPSHDPVQSES